MNDDGEIRTLLARIAQGADDGDLDAYAELFAPDAVWAMPAHAATGTPAHEIRGRDQIREGARERRAKGVQGPGTHTRHLLTTTAIELASATRATARSYFLFLGNTTGTPTLQAMGRTRTSW